MALVVRAVAIREADAVLVVMGFDPDRARLIDSLVIAFVAALAARLVSDRFRASAIGGLIAFGLLYVRVFIAETRGALDSRGTDGVFDPLGWLLTAATLLVAVALVSLSASTIGGDARAFLITAWRDVWAMSRDRRLAPGRSVRPGIVVAGLIAVVVTGPIFSDMVNFTPDMHMRDGTDNGPALAGLVAGGDNPAGAATAAGGGTAADGGTAAAAGRQPNGIPTSTSPTVSVTPGAIATESPWSVWLPSGRGRVDSHTFPAPWVGGASTTTRVIVAVPAGYDPASGRRYPVVYEVPYGLGGWAPLLNGYVTSGEAPAELMVFILAGEGPYPDSECVDSADGRERVESFVVDTVVPWVDAHYATIASPLARTIEGASQGGFCAPMLLLRHPDVFGQAIALSGYYTAGIRTGQTINAWRPFADNAAMMRAYSPVDLAAQLTPAERSRLFIVLGGSSTQPFYGAQLNAFAAELGQLGIAHAVIGDSLEHTWAGFERDLPIALHLVGLRQARLGLFATSGAGPGA